MSRRRVLLKHPLGQAGDALDRIRGGEEVEGLEVAIERGGGRELVLDRIQRHHQHGHMQVLDRLHALVDADQGMGVAAQAAHRAAIAPTQAPAFGACRLRRLQRLDDVGRVARSADADHQVLRTELLLGKRQGEHGGIAMGGRQLQVVIDLAGHLRAQAMRAAARGHQAGIVE